MFQISANDSIGICISFVVSFFCIVVIIYQSSLIGEIKKTDDITVWNSFTSTCYLTIVCTFLGFLLVWFSLKNTSLNLELLGFSLPLTFAISIAQLASGKIEKTMFEKRKSKNNNENVIK